MTSTGTYQGLSDGRKSSKVLKPPGGGSSDIFGAGNEAHSPRRTKQSFNQSSLGSGFFGNGEQASSVQHQQPQSNGSLSQASSNGGSAPETPRSKPGNDSYKRLFGPPDAPPPSTPNSKYHMRSNITLSSPESTVPSSPAKQNGNGFASPNGQLTNGNGYHHNDVVGGSSCMPRNPVTGDGVDVKPHASRRIVRRSRDGNPVTGAGYESNPVIQQNGSGGKSPSAGSDKSSTDSSSSVGGNAAVRMKNRVPPGGFSSGLW